WEIAKKYNVDFEGLKQANPQLSSPDMIMPGMKVKVPSTTKTVKKETPKKETKVKQKEKKQIPQKPIKVEEDEKEKKIEIKPEMPLPQMPEQPQMIGPPTLQMPKKEQEMNHYTMNNLPQMPPTYKMKEEKVKEEIKEPVKKKEKKEKIDTKYQIPPSLPEHLHTAVKPEVDIPTKETEQQYVPQPLPFTHMHPVYCHYLPHPCSCMSHHMVEGHMQENFPVPLPPVMPWNPNMQMPHHSYSGDCGCNSGAPSFPNVYQDNHFPMHPQYNMNDNQQPMHDYSSNHQKDYNDGHMMFGDDLSNAHHLNQQVDYHSPDLYGNMNVDEP